MTETMTALERKTAYIKGEPVDRIPVTMFHPEFASHLLGMTAIEAQRSAETLAEREINMFRRFGVDEIALYYTTLKLHSAMMVRDLEEVDKLSLDYYTFAKDERQQINFEAAELIYKEIGDEVQLTYSISGPLTLAGGLVPHTTILRGMRKQPEQVHKLLRFATDFLKGMVDTFSELDYLDYLVMDPVSSGSLLSPKQYEEFGMPYTKELVEHIHNYTDFVTLHICGNTKKIWPYIKETGVDAFSLDQVVDMEEAKEALGDEILLMGNVDPTEVLVQGNPEEVDAHVKETFEKAADSPKGFILRSGCGVPDNAPVENIEAYMEAGRRYGSDYALP